MLRSILCRMDSFWNRLAESYYEMCCPLLLYHYGVLLSDNGGEGTLMATYPKNLSDGIVRFGFVRSGRVAATN